MRKLLPKSAITRPFLFGLLALVSSCTERVASDQLTGAHGQEMRFEATSASMAQSQKDGVFLTNCQVTPSMVRVGNDFLLEVQEAFIEQRFTVGEYTDRARLMDSTEVLPKLVIIPKKGSRLSRMSLDAILQMRVVPYTRATSTNNDIIILNLTKSQLRSPFALRLHVPNPQGLSEDVNLTVWPQPIKQVLEEAYNSASVQSRRDGLLLATCTVPLEAVVQGSMRFQLQEAFIENRFVLSSRTQELQLLDSAHRQPRLVLVGSPGSWLGPAGGTGEMTLADGQRPVRYREKEKLVVFNLTEKQSREAISLRLRLRNPQGHYTGHLLRLLPTAVKAGSREPISLAASTPGQINDGMPEEVGAVFNASLAESRRRGMTLSSYRATPATVSVGRHFRLGIEEVFSEQHAWITQVTKHTEVDSTNIIGPHLAIIYQPTSKLGRLGIDWDLQLKTGGQTLAYRVVQRANLLLLHLDSRYAAQPLLLSLTVRNQQGGWEEHPITLRPVVIE